MCGRDCGACKPNENRSAQSPSFGLCIHPEVNAVERSARIPFSLPLPRVAPRTMPLRFAQTRLLAAF